MKNIKDIKFKIKNCVNDSDPWYLISGGAPDDEYNSHIDLIVSFMVNERPDLEMLEKKLYEILKHRNLNWRRVK